MVKQSRFLIPALLALAFSVSTAYAHPGRTAADGCHYCRTNCSRWGVPWNQRHCHGGGPKPAPPPAPAPKTYEFQGKTYHSLREYEAAKEAYEKALREAEEESRRLEEEKRRLEEEVRKLEEEKQRAESNKSNGGEVAGESVSQDTNNDSESSDTGAWAMLAVVSSFIALIWAAIKQKGPFRPKVQ